MSSFITVKAKLYLSKDIRPDIKEWLFMQTIDIDKYPDDDVYWYRLKETRPIELNHDYLGFNLNDSNNYLCETDEHYVLDLNLECKNKNNFIQTLFELLKPYITNGGVIGTIFCDLFIIPGNIALNDTVLSFDLGSN